MALEKLANLGARDAYLSELRQKCATSPESADAWIRLAEALPESEAKTAWSRALTLRPDDPLIIERVLRSAQDGEKVEILKKALAVFPEKVMERETQSLYMSFREPNKSAELADMLQAIPVIGTRSYTPQAISNWRSLSQRFYSSGNLEAAVLVLSKASEALHPLPADMHRTLVQYLITLKRKPEAASQVLAFLKASADRLPPIFAWRTNTTSGEVDIQMIRLARQIGDEPALRDWLKSGPPPGAAGRAVAISLRVSLRDPEVLPSIEMMATQSFARSDEREWLLSLASDLSTWPEGHAVCRQLVATYEKQSSDPWVIRVFRVNWNRSAFSWRWVLSMTLRRACRNC
ncbi:MAG: hypothetical protein QM813_15020 [Verrucomicrobiota bacterium]